MRASGFQDGAAYAEVQLGRVLIERGAARQADELLERAGAELARCGRKSSALESALVQALARVQLGQAGEALDLIDRAIAAGGSNSMLEPQIAESRSLALAALGRLEGVEITVTWSGEKAELEPDFAGYRLYKSDLSPIGPWRLIFEDPAPPLRQYGDRAQEGYQNFYAVTAFDNLGNESSLWSIYSKTFRGIEAANLPESSLDKILVVPNPYIVTNRWELNTWERRVAFTGLPAECELRIYNLSGDLVRLIEHH